MRDIDFIRQLDGSNGWDRQGRYIQHWEIGPYIVVELYQYLRDDRGRLHWLGSTETEYWGLIDGKDANKTFKTLEGAIIGLIGQKRCGPDDGRRASAFAMRMFTGPLSQSDDY